MRIDWINTNKALTTVYGITVTTIVIILGLYNSLTVNWIFFQFSIWDAYC